MSFFKKLFGSSDNSTDNKEVNTDKQVRKLLDKADSKRINDDYDEISAIYKEAHNLQPDNEEVLIAWAEYAMNKAIEEENKEWLDQSIQLFEKAYALDSEDAELLDNWAYALYIKGNESDDYELLEKEVLPKYEKASALDPENTKITYEWADVLHKISQATKDPERLKQTIEKCREIADLPYQDDMEKMDRIETYFWMTDSIGTLAIVEKNKERLNELNEAYEESMKLYKDHHRENYFTRWISDLSSVIFGMKAVEEFSMCYDLCKKAINEFPKSASIHYVWAQAKLYEARLTENNALFQEVFELYQQADKISPNNKQVLFSWAVAIMQLARKTKEDQQYKEAFAKFDKLIETDSGKDPILYQQYAASMLLYASDMDKVEECKDRIEELIKKVESITENAGAYYQAQLQALLGDSDKAFEWLKKAIQFDSETINQLESNPTLEKIRDDERFKELIG